MTKPKRAHADRHTAEELAVAVAEVEAALDGTETPLPPTDAPPAPKTGDAVLYTNRLGVGPWTGALGLPEGDAFWVNVTKPNGNTFSTVARMGDGPDAFTLAD